MDNNGEKKYNHTSLKQYSQLHFRPPETLNKNKLVKNHNTEQHPFDDRIKKVEPEYLFFVYFQISNLQF